MSEQASRWDGLKDGDTATVETPFGEVVFQYERGDASVGIPSGVFALALTVGGVEFDRRSLEHAYSDDGASLADALETWASNQ